MREQADCGHDLARLAVSALRDIHFHPRRRDGIGNRAFRAFNGGDLASDDVAGLDLTGAYGLTIKMHRAGPAQCLAAAEFRTRQSEIVAQHPQ